MNNQSYELLAAIAKEIREDAVEAKDGKRAVSDFQKATGYLFEQIHAVTNNIKVGDKIAFANALRNLASKIDER